MPIIGVPDSSGTPTPEPDVTGGTAIVSETDLLNDALGQAGGLQRITAIDDGSVSANHCLTFYPALRDSLLRAHFWNFALLWVQLAPSAVPPTIGYAFSYTLPGDFLRLKDYAGSNPTSGLTIPSTQPFSGVPYTTNFKIEGRALRTNDGSAYIQYIRRVTNAGEFDLLFYQALATMLASKLAMAITKDPQRALLLAQRGEAALLFAMSVDGQEGSVEPLRTDDLLWGR